MAKQMPKTAYVSVALTLHREITYLDKFGVERKGVVIRSDKDGFFYSKDGKMFKTNGHDCWEEVKRISVSSYKIAETTSASGNFRRKRRVYNSFETVVTTKDLMLHYVPDAEHNGCYFDTRKFRDVYGELMNLKLVHNVGYVNTILSKINMDKYCYVNGIYYNYSELIHVGNGNYEYALPEDIEDNPNHYWVCPDCGRIHRYCDRKIICQCHEMTIYGYHDWDGKLEFKSSPNEINPKLYFGVEIETEGSEDNKDLVYPMKDVFHLEYDGSLEDDASFEMITQPMTKNFIFENKDRFASLFKDLMDNGQVSHDSNNCGMHVHVSRKGFVSEDAIDRFVCLVNLMRSNNEIIARRSDDYYYHYQDIGDCYPTKKLYKNINCSDHHCAVNCGSHSDNGNHDTIEVRIFRGTLNINTFLATIEYVNNLVEVANKIHSIRVVAKDLIRGEYLPQYIKDREKATGYVFNYNKFVDFAKWHNYEHLQLQAKTYKKLRERFEISIGDMDISSLSNTALKKIFNDTVNRYR